MYVLCYMWDNKKFSYCIARKRRERSNPDLTGSTVDTKTGDVLQAAALDAERTRSPESEL